MDSSNRDSLHLAPVPGSPHEFPECLRPEVESIAQQIHDQHLADGQASDPLQDWLEAEEEVLGSCLDSPARRVPGGDLFFDLM